jgi:hypothetical protein
VITSSPTISFTELAFLFRILFLLLEAADDFVERGATHLIRLNGSIFFHFLYSDLDLIPGI